ncbi:MAG: hypothetical protein BroJett018_32630 [Chloroflexota bacterium]|nr:toll/interleukin-1 receptor domain-containing protein [Chloroflexota bacterium]NOG62338.1 toll/interleukin-1 receptor domain-containing protein [Chloroflexota bacterium]GIK65469.1 MAG: hypothetical protein BroJett018_32630 [Chloroflexota bacterium]
MAQIFISYSRHDQDIVYAVADALRAKGYDVWTDVTGIRGGATWLFEIQKAIVQSQTVLVVWSKAAHESQWVEREVIYALDHQKTIIPILIDDAKLNLALINLQPIRGQGSMDDILAQLVDILPSSLPVSLPSLEHPLPLPTQAKGKSLVALRQHLITQIDGE